MHHENAHHKKSEEFNAKKFLLIFLGVIALIIVGFLIYYASAGGLTAGKPLKIDCGLTTTILSTEMGENSAGSISVKGFHGTANEVSWTSENPEVAVASPVYGSDVAVVSKEAGSTKLIATDNAVGPRCTVSIPVKVVG